MAKPELTPEQKLQAVYTAARALCMTHDWNNGATGAPARKALLEAVNAVEALPNHKANMKASVAS